ncbi:MAG TPA: hypothetical protein VK966_09755, partial [Longimicrobiales bacterium]|nr:hypothetical protein [Longimicrobiales bacterium]
MDYQEIRDLIANARKKTPVTVHVRHDGPLEVAASESLKVFPAGEGTTILIGEWDDVREVLDGAGNVLYHHLENDRRNSAIPMLDLRGVEARIEPGCIIREGAEVGAHVIGMMGAVVNIGAPFFQQTRVIEKMGYDLYLQGSDVEWSEVEKRLDEMAENAPPVRSPEDMQAFMSAGFRIQESFGHYLRFGDVAWRNLLELAKRHGWEPAGA